MFLRELHTRKRYAYYFCVSAGFRECGARSQTPRFDRISCFRSTEFYNLDLSFFTAIFSYMKCGAWGRVHPTQTRWKNVFDQPEQSFTKNSSIQIAEKTIDFEDSTAQLPWKWRNSAKAVAKIAFRVLFFCRKHVNYLVSFLYFSNLW